MARNTWTTLYQQLISLNFLRGGRTRAEAHRNSMNRMLTGIALTLILHLKNFIAFFVVDNSPLYNILLTRNFAQKTDYEQATRHIQF